MKSELNKNVQGRHKSSARFVKFARMKLLNGSAIASVPNASGATLSRVLTYFQHENVYYFRRGCSFVTLTRICASKGCA